MFMDNWTLRLFLTLLAFIDNNVESNVLEIDHRDGFPYPANKSFSMYFVRKDRSFIITKTLADTMVILVKSSDGLQELERAIFDYGFKDMIDQPYKGEYMTIPLWQKEIKDGYEAINVSVLFSRKANNQWLYVYQIVAEKPEQRRQMLNDLKYSDAFVLLELQMSLLVPPRIELSIVSRDGRKNELMLGEVATATCRSFDGIPEMEPIFLGLTEIDVVDSTFNQERNERKVNFKVAFVDHEKKLRCMAGDTETSGIILVLHHPSQVTLDPEPGSFLENGTTILCLKADGYPSPNIHWTFLNGPSNASRYFSISETGTSFYLHKNAPLLSHWTINCTASNIIPGSAGHYNRTVKFTVGRPQEGLFSRLNLTTQLIIGVVIVGAIVLFCILIIIIICIVRKCCVNRPPPANSRKNGVPSKAGSKEKVGSSLACNIFIDQDTLSNCTKQKIGLEAEQVTLLPPGAPPNYIDLSNVGASAGLPPPPPEYELMISDDPKAALKAELRQEDELNMKYNDGSIKYSDGSLKYNEVTYAELNTSNLPMKKTPSPQISSCSDDQVIYSQIVGTVSNPYSTQRSYTEPNNV